MQIIFWACAIKTELKIFNSFWTCNSSTLFIWLFLSNSLVCLYAERAKLAWRVGMKFSLGLLLLHKQRGDKTNWRLLARLTVIIFYLLARFTVFLIQIYSFLAVTIFNHQHMAHIAVSLALDFQPDHSGNPARLEQFIWYIERLCMTTWQRPCWKAGTTYSSFYIMPAEHERKQLSKWPGKAVCSAVSSRVWRSFCENFATQGGEENICHVWYFWPGKADSSPCAVKRVNRAQPD